MRNAPGWNRTNNLLIKSQLHCQLSYRGKWYSGMMLLDSLALRHVVPGADSPTASRKVEMPKVKAQEGHLTFPRTLHSYRTLLREGSWVGFSTSAPTLRRPGGSILQSEKICKQAARHVHRARPDTTGCPNPCRGAMGSISEDIQFQIADRFCRCFCPLTRHRLCQPMLPACPLPISPLKKRAQTEMSVPPIEINSRN